MLPSRSFTPHPLLRQKEAMKMTLVEEIVSPVVARVNVKPCIVWHKLVEGFLCWVTLRDM